MTERLSIDIPPRKEKQESRADAVEVKGFVVSPNGLVSSLYPSERFVETLLRHGGMLNDGILGNGHAATVRLMHDAHGKQFAVKCCPPACYNECANELFVFSTVTSFTGIVECHGVYLYKDTLCLILQYMNGGDLSQRLVEQTCLSETESQSIASQLLLGLANVHSLGIMHRDIKPCNILLNEDGDVLLADFGIAALEDDDSQNTRFVGTHRYMSPERVTSSKHGCKADIWSLGIVLVECLTGKNPYEDEEGDLLISLAICSSPSPTVEGSPHLIDFLDKCLQSSPKDRWDAHQLLEHPFITRHL